MGEQVVWAAGEAAVPGIVQLQEHAALPVLLVGGADDPDSLCSLLDTAFCLPPSSKT